ncbi:MAG TPA: YkvA family protein [Allosphingosinicella sp.]
MADKPSFLRNLRVEVHAAWLAARDPRCPWGARLVGLLVTAYALSPIDLIPDFIPIIGLLDDALLIPAGLWLFVRMLPPGLLDEHRAAAALAAERPRSRLGIAIVLMVWLLCALLAWQLLRWARS